MNDTASQITPTCFVYNNRGHGETRYTGATVVSETKTTITVLPIGAKPEQALTFQKHKDYISGVYEDPRVSTVKEDGHMLRSVTERGGDRFYPNHLTFNVDGVARRLRAQKAQRRVSGLDGAQKALSEVERLLVHVAGYVASDEVFEQLQKLKAAINEDLTTARANG